MPPRASLLFPPFRLDMGGEQLWRGSEVVPLRPKTFAVLRCLAERPGALATEDELLDAVWGQVAVSDTVLKSCVRELREALFIPRMREPGEDCDDSNQADGDSCPATCLRG